MEREAAAEDDDDAAAVASREEAEAAAAAGLVAADEEDDEAASRFVAASLCEVRSRSRGLPSSDCDSSAVDMARATGGCWLCLCGSASLARRLVELRFCQRWLIALVCRALVVVSSGSSLLRFLRRAGSVLLAERSGARTEQRGDTRATAPGQPHTAKQNTAPRMTPS